MRSADSASVREEVNGVQREAAVKNEAEESWWGFKLLWGQEWSIQEDRQVYQETGMAMEGTHDSAPMYKGIIQGAEARAGHKGGIRNITQAYRGGVRKTKVHLQLRLAKDVKGTGASAATLVVKAGPLLNGVGESKAFNVISHSIFASSLRYYGLDGCTT